MLQLDEIAHLRNSLENKGSPIEQTEWNACSNWCTEAYISLEGSRIASLRLIRKGKWKSKDTRQELCKTKDHWTDITPAAPHLSPPEGSCFTGSLPELLSHSEVTIRQWPLKIKLLTVGDEPLQVSFTPWSKTELRNIFNSLPKFREEAQKFFEEFRVTMGAYDPSCWVLISLHIRW